MPAASVAETYGSIPELMRVARGTYKRAVDERFAAEGFEDLPNPGGYLLAYLDDDEGSAVDRIEGLGIKRGEVAQLVEPWSCAATSPARSIRRTARPPSR
jgi:hypothetical protein